MSQYHRSSIGLDSAVRIAIAAEERALESALQRNSPEGAVVTARACDTADEDELHPLERQMLKWAVRRRRQEFSAGRDAAARCLQNFLTGGWPLLSDQHRCPLWPPGLVGSISHSRRFATAVVARESVAGAIGVDVEDAERDLRRITRAVLSERERERAAGVCVHWATLVHFSAKESVFKAIYPELQRYVEFGEVELSVNYQTSTFTAQGPGKVIERLTGTFGISRGQFFSLVFGRSF